MCGDATETVNTLSVDARSSPREGRKRHDKVALRVHLEMCKKYGIEFSHKKYDYQPSTMAKNGELELRITSDMTIDTDKVLKQFRPDITMMYKDTQKWTLSDIAVPVDQIIVRTEEEKVEYQELAFEIRRIYEPSKVTIIPIVIGASGNISKSSKA